jgi:halimadienyl-diphosphate synthase
MTNQDVAARCAGEASSPLAIGQAASELVTAMVSEPWGDVSPSVYETARVVVLAPWLTGQRERVEFLLTSQRLDGSWGGTDGYELVPTLSAVDALLDLVSVAGLDSPQDMSGNDRLHAAAHHGLSALSERILHSGPQLPDTPAIEWIVPTLIASINRRLDVLESTAMPGWRQRRLLYPPEMDITLPERIRAELKRRQEIPDKLLHCLEVVGDVGDGHLRPTRTGSIGASPAATAAWLRTGPPPEVACHARRYLDGVAARHRGPVPSVLPITAWETAMVLSSLMRAGIEFRIPVELPAILEDSLGPVGAAGGDGLPPDADTSAVTIDVLSTLGLDRDLSCFDRYDVGTHFCAWPGERHASVSVNSHVLDVFARATPSRSQSPKHASAIGNINAWLLAQQHPDGYWTDKWHASAFYPTACCVTSLAALPGRTSSAALGRAVDWVLAAQHDDGSWGRWQGTAEETAYAIQILLAVTDTVDDRPIRQSVRRGYRFLVAAHDEEDYPPLWHDKDLYCPTRMVRAAVLAALYAAGDRLAAA